MLLYVVLLNVLSSVMSYDNGAGAETPPMGWSTWCTNVN